MLHLGAASVWSDRALVHRRILGYLGNIVIQLEPGLDAVAPELDFGLEPGGIVERTGLEEFHGRYSFQIGRAHV